MKKNIFGIFVTSVLSFIFLFLLTSFVNNNKIELLYSKENFSPLCFFAEIFYLIAYAIVFRKKIYLNAEDNKLFDAKKQLICYYNDLGKYHLIIFAVCAFLTTIGSLIKALSFIGIVGFLCMPMTGILGTNHILGGFVGLISHLILLPLIVLGTKYVHFKFNCNVKK